MATHFSANQYENAFAAKRLQNWQIPGNFKEHPGMRDGFTRPISNERGHLLDGVKRSEESPWGTFKGTWHQERDCSRTKHCHTLTATKTRQPSCLRRDDEPSAETEQRKLVSSKGETNLAQSNSAPLDNRVSSAKRSPTMQKEALSPTGSESKLSRVGNSPRPGSQPHSPEIKEATKVMEIDG